MTDGDRAAPRVHARVVVVDAEVVEEGEHLDGERLVQFEQADVVDRQAGLPQRLLGGGHRADAHDLRLDAGEGEADQRIFGAEAEFLRGRRAGEQAHGRAVVEAGGVAGGDPAVRAERRLQPGQALHRRLGARRLVAGGESPSASLRMATGTRSGWILPAS